MSITCQICNTEFEKIIPWQHLKTHNISSAEYKEKFGPLYSPETIAKHSLKIPHNKGQKITDPAMLEKHRGAIARREERYAAGDLVRSKQEFTQERRQKISDKQKQFAANNPEAMKARTQKALATKITNGYDFGSAMRGKSQTSKSKETSRQNAFKLNEARSNKSNIEIAERIEELNLTLHNQITDPEFNLTCNTCNTDFTFTKQYFQPAKFKETMCPTCHPRAKPVSNKEVELYNFVTSLWSTAIQGYRPSYHSKEIDVFIPEKRIGFEFNGLYWHSEQVLASNNQSPKKDHEKLLEFKQAGIRLVQIFEDEWDLKQDIVKDRIRSILGLNSRTIYARKCEVVELSAKEANAFCDKHHIMGGGKSKVKLGLRCAGELVSVMTFSNSNLSRKGTEWEITRFVSKSGFTVVGAAGKLFNYFVRHYNAQTVVSYSDNRWSNGNLYKAIGFALKHSGTPNYWYLKANTPGRIHRFNLRKQANEPKDKTEIELRLEQGYMRIWDSGAALWIWDSSK